MTQDAELPRPSPDECSLASLAHALQIVGSFIAPLIIFLIRRESRFVSFHALQALLLQIVYMVLWFTMMGVMFVGVFVPLVMQEGKRDSSEGEKAPVEQKAEEKGSGEKREDAAKAEPAEPNPPTKRPVTRKSEPPPIWFLIAFPIFWVVYMFSWVAMLVGGIVYCIKASRGEWAAYPIVGRWAKKLLHMPTNQ